MLVVSRQVDEVIMIGDDIEVMVTDIRGDKVRLGISAPKHLAVHRKEVYGAILKERNADSLGQHVADFSNLAPASPPAKET